MLDLFLFTSDVSLAQSAESAGVASVIVDWERHGKADRQRGYDTATQTDPPVTVRQLADALAIPVTVRVDALAGEAEDDIERALDLGARILMLPMAASAGEVERFLGLVRGRARTLVQIETAALVRDLEALRTLDWEYGYVGLNDLMISRGGSWLWEPLLDGTMDEIYEALDGRPVGFGGGTVMDGGSPIPYRQLLLEQARLGCALTFLRRTFHRDIGGRDLALEMGAIEAAWSGAQRRPPARIDADRASFVDLLRRLRPDA